MVAKTRTNHESAVVRSQLHVNSLLAANFKPIRSNSAANLMRSQRKPFQNGDYQKAYHRSRAISSQKINQTAPMRCFSSHSIISDARLFRMQNSSICLYHFANKKETELYVVRTPNKKRQQYSVYIDPFLIHECTASTMLLYRNIIKTHLFRFAFQNNIF